MIRKPVILILTSRDEKGNVSKNLKDAIQKVGSHNAVIVSDEKYGDVKKVSSLDKLMDSGQEYAYFRITKDKGVIEDFLKVKKFSKKITRIINLLKRYRPEYVLCLTPYAHHSMIEAKKRAKLHIPVISVLSTFTVPKTNFDESTNVIIVENSDIKQDLVRIGIRSKDVMVMGLPFDMKKLSKEELDNQKQELGLPKSKTVLLNFSSNKVLQEVFYLMMDQGGIVNLAVYCDDAKLRVNLAQKASKYQNMTVIFIQSKDLIENYLKICDMVITEYDPSIIYKSFHIGVPSVVLDGGEQSKKDIQYLSNNGLLLRAKEPIETVGLMYQILDSEEGKAIAEAGEKWVEMSSIENIAQFLTSYIVV